jgi:YHS domain-containing protein
VVSYFRADGVPQKGTEQFKVQHDGVTYLFANAENVKAFKSAPASFAPQYGGHCAWAMSRGSLAPGDPKLYKIVDDKLYLNFNSQVQQTWLKDVSGFVSKADAAWREIPDDAEFGG